MQSSGALPRSLGEAQAILVVDDDPQVLKYVSRMLTSLGYSHILQAESATDAVNIWNAHGSKIDLLVSDFVMPGLTGDDLALQLLKMNPALKVLFISGNDPYSLDSAIPLHPGRNFLQKPFTVADIGKAVGNLETALAREQR